MKIGNHKLRTWALGVCGLIVASQFLVADDTVKQNSHCQNKDNKTVGTCPGQAPCVASQGGITETSYIGCGTCKAKDESTCTEPQAGISCQIKTRTANCQNIPQSSACQTVWGNWTDPVSSNDGDCNS